MSLSVSDDECRELVKIESRPSSDRTELVLVEHVSERGITTNEVLEVLLLDSIRGD